MTPDAEISWIAEPAGAALLESFPGIDRILVFELKARKGWIARNEVPVRLPCAARRTSNST